MGRERKFPTVPGKLSICGAVWLPFFDFLILSKLTTTGLLLLVGGGGFPRGHATVRAFSTGPSPRAPCILGTQFSSYIWVSSRSHWLPLDHWSWNWQAWREPLAGLACVNAETNRRLRGLGKWRSGLRRRPLFPFFVCHLKGCTHD